MPTAADLTYNITVNGVTETKNLFDVLDRSDVYVPQGSNIQVIKLKGLLKLAEKEKIVEKRAEVIIQPTEGNLLQHGVAIWLGYKGDQDPDNWSRGYGECSKLNSGRYNTVHEKAFITNPSTGAIEHDPVTTSPLYKDVIRTSYIQNTEIDSQYRLAMAEKRAYSRALLKLIQLFGVYCDVESQAFSNKTATTDYDL